ncbi:MAG: CBS domain-containing protein [Nitrospinae bacterium]|nr:CBS domain-containing protein [Nitrospinota bacterium]
MSSIREHMSDPIPRLEPETVVTQAAKVMVEKEVHAVLVEDGGKCVGIVTEVDITRKVVAEGQDPNTVNLSSIMSCPLVTLDASLSMEEASLCMRKNNIRQIAITEDRHVVGTLIFNNVTRYYHQKYLEGKDPVAEFWGAFDHTFYDEDEFRRSIEKFLRDIHLVIGDTCQTTKAIDRKESLEEISRIAREEGLTDIAQILDIVEPV